MKCKSISGWIIHPPRTVCSSSSFKDKIFKSLTRCGSGFVWDFSKFKAFFYKLKEMVAMTLPSMIWIIDTALDYLITSIDSIFKHSGCWIYLFSNHLHITWSPHQSHTKEIIYFTAKIHLRIGIVKRTGKCQPFLELWSRLDRWVLVLVRMTGPKTDPEIPISKKRICWILSKYSYSRQL